MKKIMYLFLIAILVLVGCVNNTNVDETQSTKEAKQTSRIETTVENTTAVETITEEPTTPVPEPTESALAIRAVLKNESPYIDVNNGYKETYKNDLNYYLGKIDVNIRWDNFAMFDVDSDGQREVRVIIRNLRKYGNHINLEDRTRLILKYYQGQVYGYQCSQIMELGRNNYFIWDSASYQYMEGEEKYSGGGKIEFKNEKIKYIYYVREENEKERKWLKNLIPGADVEVVVDKEMCEYAEKECEKYSEYGVWDIGTKENIDKYIY